MPSVQDVTHKVVEAIGTIAGSSLEQTTWLRRNLEVKASPQIVVDGGNLESDVEGVRSDARRLSVWFGLVFDLHCTAFHIYILI